MQDLVETRAGRFWIEEGILRFVAAQGTEQSRQDAEESMRVFAQLAAGKRRPAVMVIVGVKGLSRDARAIYAGPESVKTFSAAAIVVSGSTVGRTLVNFILAVSKPAYPTRMFEAVDEALSWARAHVLAD